MFNIIKTGITIVGAVVAGCLVAKANCPYPIIPTPANELPKANIMSVTVYEASKLLTADKAYRAQYREDDYDHDDEDDYFLVVITDAFGQTNGYHYCKSEWEHFDHMFTVDYAKDVYRYETDHGSAHTIMIDI